MEPSARLLRAVVAERTTLERQRAQLAREANSLRASLARIEAGLAEIDALCVRLDGFAPGATADEAVEDTAARVSKAGQALIRNAASDADSGRAEGAARTLRGPAIREVAVALLVADGRDALHYREWFDLLTREGYDVAGKDPLAVFLTQITRSPSVRKGARPGEYALDRGAPQRLQLQLSRLLDELAALPARTSDLTELRTRRAQLNHEIAKVEKALEEVERAA